MLNIIKNTALVLMINYLSACNYYPINKGSGVNKTYNTGFQEKKVMKNNNLKLPAGKRIAPEDVHPITLDGVRYEVLHWGKRRGLDQNGGYIVAIDSNGKELWVSKVYSIDYDSRLENDVQDVFIQSMELSEDKRFLNIVDEDNRLYKFDLITHKVY